MTTRKPLSKPLTKQERIGAYLAYREGWFDSVHGDSMTKQDTWYVFGYRTGTEAYEAMNSKAQKLTGYSPSPFKPTKQ